METKANREERVSQALKQIGIGAHINGYHFIRYAVLSTMEAMSQNEVGFAMRVCKELYPNIAKHFGKSAVSVARAIRHAIESAMLYGDIDFIHKVFGNVISDKTGKVVNSAFIATLADYLLLIEKRIAENRQEEAQCAK